MSDKKIFTIQINGIDTACEDLNKLGNCVDQLDKKFVTSKFSTLLASTFSNANNIVKGFDNSIEKLSATLNKMKPVVETINALNEVNKKAQEESIKAVEKKIKVENSELKLLTSKNSALTKLHESRLKQLETEKKAIEEKTKKYGEEYKFTTENLKVYREYYESLEYLYKDDSIKLKETLDEKVKFEADYLSKSNVLLKKKTEYELLVASDKYAEELKSVKHLEDVKEGASLNDIVATKLQLKEKETLYAEHNTRIANLQNNMLVKEQSKGFAGRGYIDMGETRKNYDELQKMYAQNIERVRNEKDEVARLYDEQLKNFEENSQGWLQLQNEKQKKLGDMNKQIATDQESMKSNTDKYFEAMAENINKMYAEYDKYYGKIGGLTQNFLSYELDGLKDDLADTQKILDEKTKAYTNHKNKVEELEKEAETASGGRAEVLREQIARETEAREEALKEQKNAQKEKDEIQKQIDRKEKQKNKIDKVQQIAKATADQAAGVVKAWALGPIAGPIMAAITIATTAIQIARIKREWEKLEDGGLLRGRRHSQGGMRIEGTNIEVEGDEFVVNRDSTRKNLGLIDFINRNRRELSPDDIKAYYMQSGKQQVVVNHQVMRHMYEDGGILTDLDAASGASSQQMNEKILEAIGRINFKPVVSVVDITNAQQTITGLQKSVGA